MRLTAILLLLLLTPVYSTIICPLGYKPGYIGCYYVKEISFSPFHPNPPPLKPKPIKLTCDHPEDKVAQVNDTEKFEKLLKPFYDEMLDGDSKIVNGYIVVTYTDENGLYKLRYICYREYGPYIRESYSARDYIREHTSEVYGITHGVEIMSLYAGILVIAGLLGRLVGMGLATWGYTIMLLIASKTGLILIPDVVIYIALAVSTILSLIIALSIYKV